MVNLSRLPKLFYFLTVCLFLQACQFLTNSNEQESYTPPAYLQEEYRPQYHFTPPANWMNDPNGMVYHEGEYHLFYQYYPDSTVWGPMHWGHAVSKDMVNWKHLPIALYPDSLGLIFSGSAVVDHNNSSGLGENEKAPLIAIFTHHNMEGERKGTNTYQYQSIAYSNDNGRTWTKYAGNPVVENPGIKDFRDPKVIWHEQTQRWVMVFAAYDRVRFYTSPNLIDWEYASEYAMERDDRLWECPDLFPMTVEGSKETKWVLITSIQREAPNGGTATSYFVGDFDGKTFVADLSGQQWLDYGTDNYAFVTWSDIPEKDGRRLGIGWMSNWQYATVVPTQNWRSAMTLPRSLSLHQTAGGYRLRSLPVKELQQLEGKTQKLKSGDLTHGQELFSEIQSPYKLELTFRKPESGRIGIRFSNEQGQYVDVTYESSSGNYYIDRRKSGKVDFHEKFRGLHRGVADYSLENVNMLLYLDHSSIELFADEGRCVMTDIFFPDSPFTKVSVLGNAQLGSGKVTLLKPARFTE